MKNKVLLAALVGGVVSFFAGWVIFGMIMPQIAGEMPQGMEKDPPEMWALVVGNLVWGLFYALLFDRLSVSSLQSGAMNGAWIGLMIALGVDLIMYATMTIMPLKIVMIDPLITGIYAAITGAAVGWMLGYNNKPATA